MMQKLNEIPDKNPFRVPENYFEEVNRKIISVTSGYNQAAKKVGLYDRFRPYFLVAASITGFVIISYTAVKLLSAERINSEVSDPIYSEFSQSYFNDFDIITLEENAASLVLSEEVPEVSKTEIIDYLLLENIEISDIYALL